MTIDEIIQRNYDTTVRSCKITESTTFDDFITKIDEEVNKLYFAKFKSNMPVKMADVALVLFAMAKHYDIDLVAEMEKKVLINEKRQ